MENGRGWNLLWLTVIYNVFNGKFVSIPELINRQFKFFLCSRNPGIFRPFPLNHKNRSSTSGTKLQYFVPELPIFFRHNEDWLFIPTWREHNNDFSLPNNPVIKFSTFILWSCICGNRTIHHQAYLNCRQAYHSQAYHLTPQIWFFIYRKLKNRFAETSLMFLVSKYCKSFFYS